MVRVSKENVNPSAASAEKEKGKPINERDRLRKEAALARDESDDPLIAYQRLIDYTSDRLQPGLLVLLDETIRMFAFDVRYKQSPTLLTLAIKFASSVQDPTVVFEWLLLKEIGVACALFYEEYAVVLELGSQTAKAEEIYQAGITRKAQPLSRLKRRHTEFQARLKSPSPSSTSTTREVSTWSLYCTTRQTIYGSISLPPSTSGDTKSSKLTDSTSTSSTPTLTNTSTTSSTLKLSAEDEILRRTPLVNHKNALSPTPPGSLLSECKFTFDSFLPSGRKHPYAHFLAPKPPLSGRREERLMFDLQDCLSEDGRESCFEEVRLKEMGLLGKKWAPIPEPDVSLVATRERDEDEASEAESASTSEHEHDPEPRGAEDEEDEDEGRIAVKFNDQDENASSGTKTNNGLARRQSRGHTFEPTVTINTKAAMADVFGFFNSPEKTTNLAKARIKSVDLSDRPLSALSTIGEGMTPAKSEPMTPGGRIEVFMDEDEEPERDLFHPAKPMNDENAGAIRRPFQILEDDLPGNLKTPLSTKPLQVNKRTPLSFVKPPSSSSAGEVGPASPPSSTEFTFDTVFSQEPVKQQQQQQQQHQSFQQPHAVHTLTHPARRESINVSTVFSLARSPDDGRPGLSSLYNGDSKADDDTDVEGVFRLPDESGSPAPPAPKPLRSRDMPFFGHAPLSLGSGKGNNRVSVAFVEPPAAAAAAGGNNKASSVFAPFVDTEEDNGDGGEDDSYYETPAAKKVVSFGHEQRHSIPVEEHGEEEEEGEGGYYDETPEIERGYGRPISGRFAAINVLTPITERTYEFTTSTKVTSSTPSTHLSQGYGRGHGYGHGTGHYLAPEEEVIDKTSALTLNDSLVAAASFHPSNPCNPFDPAILGHLLSLMPQENGHHDSRHLDTHHLQAMQDFVASAAKRRGSDTTRSRISGTLPAVLYDLKLGNELYRVVDKLGEGGFGAVFRAEEDIGDLDPDNLDDDLDDVDLGVARQVALKAVRPRNAWEFYILRHLRRRLPPSLCSSVAEPKSLYMFQNESIMVLDVGTRGTLLDLVNRADKGGYAAHGGVGLQEPLAMFFAVELLRVVEGMHAAGFIHGDMKIDNCLLRLEESDTPLGSRYDPSGKEGWRYHGIKLIDFGRTIDTTMFPADQSFLGDWETNKGDCIEAQEGRPWTFQTDYFGLAGIFHVLLFGKFIETVFDEEEGIVQLKNPLKRYWQGEIWHPTFEVLLNSGGANEDGSLPILSHMRELREQMEAWLVQQPSLKLLVKKVRISTE